mmetsp:Transcript_24441/g.58978  ORF Transcript_24441/g.58978 Transcript_24441/m.58978 type:complete len:454 (-) Transcript_24441:230-1591(-)
MEHRVRVAVPIGKGHGVDRGGRLFQVPLLYRSPWRGVRALPPPSSHVGLVLGRRPVAVPGGHGRQRRPVVVVVSSLSSCSPLGSLPLESHVPLALHGVQRIPHPIHEAAQRRQPRHPQPRPFRGHLVPVPAVRLGVEPHVHPPQRYDLLPDERVRRKQRRIATFRRILLAAAPDEVHHLGAPYLRIGERWSGLGGYQEDGPQGIQVGVRRRPLGHLDDGDAQAPYVRAAIVVRLFYHLRRDPEGRSDHGLSFVDGVGQLGADTKVGELDVTVVRKQDVAALDVAVAYLLLVKVLQPQHAPRARRAYRLLGHGEAPPPPRGLDEIAHGPAIAQLHDDPHLARFHPLFGRAHEALEVSDDEGGVALREDVDFAHDLVGLLVALLVGHDLDGDDGARGPVTGAEDLAEGSLAEHFVEFELRGAILGHGIRQIHHDSIQLFGRIPENISDLRARRCI